MAKKTRRRRRARKHNPANPSRPRRHVRPFRSHARKRRSNPSFDGKNVMTGLAGAAIGLVVDYVATLYLPVTNPLYKGVIETAAGVAALGFVNQPMIRTSGTVLAALGGAKVLASFMTPGATGAPSRLPAPTSTTRALPSAQRAKIRGIEIGDDLEGVELAGVGEDLEGISEDLEGISDDLDGLGEEIALEGIGDDLEGISADDVEIAYV